MCICGNNSRHDTAPLAEGKRSRGHGVLHKQQILLEVRRHRERDQLSNCHSARKDRHIRATRMRAAPSCTKHQDTRCLLYTSDAADDLTRVGLGGRLVLYKKQKIQIHIWVSEHRRMKNMTTTTFRHIRHDERYQSVR